MEELHLSEIRQLKRMFRERGLYRVPERMTVVDAFLATEDHVTPRQLADSLAAAGQTMDEAFVLETLEILRRLGFAEKKEFAGVTVFEHRHLDEHHDHLICTNCGRIVEFVHPDLEKLQREIAASHGFKLLDHRHQLYGLCSECQTDRVATMPLTFARAGESVRVAGYLGGRLSRARLAEMGLTPGTTIEVLTADGGPVILACRGSRLALGKSLAGKITCVPLEEKDD